MKSKSKKIGLVVLTAILAISVFSLIPTPVGAQPVEVWNVTWPGSGTAVATAGDYVYLAGVNTNWTDVFLNKYDKDGNLLWNSTWEMFAPEVGLSNDVATAAAGDSVYLAGTCGFSNVTGGAFLNKYDIDGNFLWNITWGTVFTAGYAAAATEDCVYVAGETAPSNVSDFDAFLNKYDSEGNILWNITWGGPGTYSASATATSGDGVYVAGRAPGGKTFLNKYNSTDGSLMWNLTWKGDGMGVATATGDNAVYMAGRTGLDTVPGAFLNKYNSTNGNLIWNITWGGIGTLGRATATSGDSVYLAGLNESIDFDFCNVFLNKCNSTDGSLIWNITWGKTGDDHGRAIATAEDGVVYLVGNRGSFLANESDAFLVKFSEPTPIPLAPGLPVPGFISVSSSPPSADISLDGRPINAITPHIITVEVIGTHTIKLSLEGYHDWSQTVEVKANKTSELHATLTPVATPTPTPTPSPPGFEAGFAIAGLLAVAYLVLRRR
jgi:PGF-CTERM protein